MALLLGVALPSAALAADLTAAQLFAGGKVMDRESVIVASAKPHDADMCRGFSLTESQVKDFFRRAAVMAEAVQRRDYQDAPCEVEGHIRYQDQTFLFIIGAAYTGEIQIGPDKYLYFGCATCKDMFDYGYLTPPAASTPAPASATLPP
ncbi:MAG TPA: hypothetical protein VGH71_09350 [Gammaproteobacteria bacterium]